MEQTDYSVVLITSRREEAEGIAHALLEEKKAACVNIIPEISSLFWWEGKLETQSESLLVVKTRTASLPDVIELVKSVHSYEVPEIIALPITGGNRAYLDWISQMGETGV